MAYTFQTRDPPLPSSDQDHHNQPDRAGAAPQRVKGAASQRAVTAAAAASSITRSGFRASQMQGRGIAEERVDFEVEEVDEAGCPPPTSRLQQHYRQEETQGIQEAQEAQEAPPTHHATPSLATRSLARPAEAAARGPSLSVCPSQSVRPTSGKSLVIRPGEPHHFGVRVDRANAQVVCTLCRCRNPMSHGDAYTMLHSPRGYSLSGQAIDWQMAKSRMLDHYQAEQISHEQEMAAIPYVFDEQTAQAMLEQGEVLRKAIAEGQRVGLNTVGNTVSWHNQGGRAREEVTEGGLKTKIDRTGYGGGSGQGEW